MVQRAGIVEEAWQTYRRDVLPADASDVQVRECRVAFFGGASALYMSIMRLMSPGSEPTAQDMALMASIHAELTAFKESLA